MILIGNGRVITNDNNNTFIENGCIASLVIDMQGITCSMTMIFRFTYK